MDHRSRNSRRVFAVSVGVVAYRSWVRNELLELNDAFGNDIGTRNVPRTNHQGIEASLEVELLREILVPKQLNRSGDRLSFDQSYTLNDFHFDQGDGRSFY